MKRPPKTAPLVNPYPTTRVLSAMVAANDDAAVQYVLAELVAHGGNVRETANAIGCSERALYLWRDQNRRLKAGFKKHALGRTGAAGRAAAARRITTPEADKPARRPPGARAARPGGSRRGTRSRPSK